MLQNNQVEFSFLTTTYMGLAQAFPSIVGTIGFWYIQKYWKVKTKLMVSIKHCNGILF